MRTIISKNVTGIIEEPCGLGIYIGDGSLDKKIFVNVRQIVLVAADHAGHTLTIELANGRELIITEGAKYFDKVIEIFNRAEARVSTI